MVENNVGIITLYYRNYNFGGMLQAYALQSVVEKMGVKCEQICFERIEAKSSETKYEKYKRVIIKRFSNGFFEGIKYIGKCVENKVMNPIVSLAINNRLSSFAKFGDMIPHSPDVYQYDNIDECLPLYDTFICGSDQIWNCWGIKGDAKCFSLGFVPADKVKISYAASTGGQNLPKAYIDKLRPGIQKLNFISIREKSSVQLIEDISGKNVKNVLDPVMLLDAADWDRVEGACTIPSKSYAVCYMLGTDKKQRKSAIKFVHKNKSKVLSFPYINGNCFIREDMFFGDIRDFSAGPAEFVKLIKNAEFIITDSFHACVFSMIYHKPFYIFERGDMVASETMNTRIYDFLEEFGLQSRLVTPESLLNRKEIEPIDYAYADLVLKRRKRESLEFLKNALELDK
jgi:hypothetical protein